MTTENTPAPAYTRADLQRWKTDMLLKRPTTRHTGGQVLGIQVVSFDIRPSENGLQLLIVNDHGEEAMMLLNPVVAAALLQGVRDIGPKAGWLGQDETPIEPID